MQILFQSIHYRQYDTPFLRGTDRNRKPHPLLVFPSRRDLLQITDSICSFLARHHQTLEKPYFGTNHLLDLLDPSQLRVEFLPLDKHLLVLLFVVAFLTCYYPHRCHDPDLYQLKTNHHFRCFQFEVEVSWMKIPMLMEPLRRQEEDS